MCLCAVHGARAHVPHRCRCHVEARKAEVGGEVGSHSIVLQRAFDRALSLGTRRHVATSTRARCGGPAIVHPRVIVLPPVDLEVIPIICLPKQAVRRDSIISDSIRGPDLDVHPNPSPVWRAHCRLRAREPPPRRESKRLSWGALLKHVPPAGGVVIAVRCGAALRDDCTVWVNRVKENLERASRRGSLYSVERTANPRAVDVEQGEGSAEAITLDEEIETQVCGRQRVVHCFVLPHKGGLVAMRTLEVRIARDSSRCRWSGRWQ
eukprot:5587983-Prymnesium_polylepis.2